MEITGLLLFLSGFILVSNAGVIWQSDNSNNIPLLREMAENANSSETKHMKHILGPDGHDDMLGAEFQEFKAKYNKSTQGRGEHPQIPHFKKNMQIIEALNKGEKGTARYGATKFADLSPEEFRKNYLTPVWDLSVADGMDKAVVPQVNDVPDAFDWRKRNAVTPVKNQGSCGSCWAFSTTGNIEGQWAIKKGKLLSLSEQELVDCDKVDQGCNGGLPANAYKAIEKLGGIETEKEYPYEARGERCQFKKGDVRAYVNNSLSISTDEEDMKVWLYKNGPISIGINANAMQFYFGGISHPFSFLCNPSSLDHGVLIVGYGVKNGFLGQTPFWIIKNSWGKNWGVSGYYLVYRGKGVCGLNRMPTSAVID